jgi:hypothetical protein
MKQLGRPSKVQLTVRILSESTEYVSTNYRDCISHAPKPRSTASFVRRHANESRERLPVARVRNAPTRTNVDRIWSGVSEFEGQDR